MAIRNFDNGTSSLGDSADNCLCRVGGAAAAEPTLGALRVLIELSPRAAGSVAAAGGSSVLACHVCGGSEEARAALATLQRRVGTSTGTSTPDELYE